MNDKLKAARKSRNWTQLQVSLELDCDYRMYRRWERGKRQPSLRNLKKLCALFGMTREELGFDAAL